MCSLHKLIFDFLKHDVQHNMLFCLRQFKHTTYFQPRYSNGKCSSSDTCLRMKFNGIFHCFMITQLSDKATIVAFIEKKVGLVWQFTHLVPKKRLYKLLFSATGPRKVEFFDNQTTRSSKKSWWGLAISILSGKWGHTYCLSCTKRNSQQLSLNDVVKCLYEEWSADYLAKPPQYIA